MSAELPPSSSAFLESAANVPDTSHSPDPPTADLHSSDLHSSDPPPADSSPAGECDVSPDSVSEKPAHAPVLPAETLHYLDPETGKTYVDATLGAGGHAEALLEASAPEGKLLGIDQDPVALTLAGRRLSRFSSRFCSVRGNFSSLIDLLPPDFQPITGGLLADIGVSSMQLDARERGFSFSRTAPLDMRMSPETSLTAAHVINTYAEAELRRIFSEYGEEHLAGAIARGIVRRRGEKPFETTTELADWIAGLYRSRDKREKIHPATRVFQAVRIEVNDELGHLRRLLDQLPQVLAPGARVVVITFHSLEDRLVKRFFQRESRDCVCPPNFPVCKCDHRPTLRVLTGKPVQAEAGEIRINPRARSAKLRAAIRLPD